MIRLKQSSDAPNVNRLRASPKYAMNQTVTCQQHAVFLLLMDTGEHAINMLTVCGERNPDGAGRDRRGEASSHRRKETEWMMSKNMTTWDFR